MNSSLFRKALIFGIIAIFFGMAVVPATTSYSKDRDVKVANITLVSQDTQFVPSSTGGEIVGPFYFAKISANFSTRCGRVQKSGLSIAFEFGPYGIGYVNLRPFCRWNDPIIDYSNCTGYPASHSFLIGANWFLGKVKYHDDRVLVNGFCFGIIMFRDYWYMRPNLTLCSVDDAYVDINQSDQNFGAAEVLEVTDYNGNETNRTYIKFDVSNIPDDVTVHYALLQLYCCGEDDFSEPYVGAYRVNTSWDEDTITWNDQPEFSSICEHNFPLQSIPGYWTEAPTWDITELVRGWKSGNVPNNGVVIKYCNPCQNDITRRIFRSKEYVEYEPRLIISYY